MSFSVNLMRRLDVLEPPIERSFVDHSGRNQATQHREASVLLLSLCGLGLPIQAQIAFDHHYS